MEKEIWKTIEGYPNYMVSNLGRIKSLNYNRTGEEKILKNCKDKYGYLQIGLCKKGKRKNYRIHRLVAQAFLPNPDNLPEVNHKDEDKTNNIVTNIEYCDSKYNNNYGTINKRRAKVLQNRKDLSIPILQFTKNGEIIRKWESATQVEREIGLENSNITACCKGKRKSAGGFIWMYADIDKIKKVA